VNLYRMDITWHVFLLGELRLVGPDGEITRFPTRKTAALLAYLTYHLGKERPRELLADLFWPEDEPKAARHSLSVALSAIRRLFEVSNAPQSSVLSANSFGIRLLDSSVKTDVADFESALRRSENETDAAARIALLTEANRLYRGPLLPGYYDEWIHQERLRLESAHFGLLDTLTRLLETSGRLEEALEQARAAVALDPLRESAHRALIRLYARTGQPGAAIRQYSELEGLLRRELDAIPSAETRELIEAVRAGEIAPGAATARGPEPPAAPKVSETVNTEAKQSSAAVSARLPARLSRFFGRAEEIEQIATSLTGSSPRKNSEEDTVRLVTLIGPAGSGKTRLAIQATERIQRDYDGVWFVPLADISDARLIPEAILNNAGLRPDAEIDPLESAVRALEAHRYLLVLDNLEHLGEQGALVVRDILERASGTTCLATSRRRLGLMGEREVPVLPLPVPVEDAGLEALESNPSVQLFSDRAHSVRHSFRLTAENAPVIARICRRLEGIPLALELAASRAAALTPSQILARLDQPFSFLVSSQSDVPARHRTLLGAIEWSVRLVPEETQTLFEQLSVFRGGWNLEAVAAIAMGENSTEDELKTLDSLERLLEGSLIQVEERTPAGTGEPYMRYGMLESLREYALTRLTVNDSDALRSRHAVWFLKVASEAVAHLRGPDQVIWLSRLEEDHENLRGAMGWFLERDPLSALRMGAALSQFWHIHGYYQSGEAYLNQALEKGAMFRQTHEYLDALRAASTLMVAQSKLEQAGALCEHGLVLARELGDRLNEAAILNTYARIHMNRDIYEPARELYEQCLVLRREVGDLLGVASVLGNLGILARRQGDLIRAKEIQLESLEIRRELNDQTGVALSLLNLANIALDGLDYATAARMFSESLTLNWHVGAKESMLICIQGIASSERGIGRLERAATLYAAVENLRVEMNCPVIEPYRSTLDSYIADVRSRLSPDTFMDAWNKGTKMSLDNAAEFALVQDD
jgi:predicted ATPase/DNA-binding SARP family transcriptional activator